MHAKKGTTKTGGTLVVEDTIMSMRATTIFSFTSSGGTQHHLCTRAYFSIGEMEHILAPRVLSTINGGSYD